MLKKLKSFNQGFTIIEVLIVLAIAGLILLIVFLAVPALQRNSRNTQRNADAAAVLGIMNEWANNNNGATPTSICLAAGQVSVGGGAVCPIAAANNPVNVGVGGQFTTFSLAPLPSPAPAAAVANTLQIYTVATCGAGNTLVGGSGRSFVAWYQNEPTVNSCKSS